MSRRRLPKRWICSGWRATSRATRRPLFSTGGRLSRHSARWATGSVCRRAWPRLACSRRIIGLSSSQPGCTRSKGCAAAKRRSHLPATSDGDPGQVFGSDHSVELSRIRGRLRARPRGNRLPGPGRGARTPSVDDGGACARSDFCAWICSTTRQRSATSRRALVLTREIGSDAWTGTTASGLARTLVSNGLAAQAAVVLEPYVPVRPSHTVGGALVLGAQCEVAWRVASRGKRSSSRRTHRPGCSRRTSAKRRTRLLKLRGHALVALGRFEDGVLALQQARAIALEISARPLLWRIDAALGRVFTLLRQTTKAQHYFNTARACVEELADAIADAFAAGRLPGRSSS